ncbi:MAG: hypothetical protein IKV92_08635 [Akkermansia sp.]|nr:hypothetical protein [Akkermansia sp.]
MVYIISLTLLVALGAWVVASYLRLFHLYERVQCAWLLWHRATLRRNECLLDFATQFAAYLPAGDVLPRDLHRWTQDSGRALEATPTAPKEGNFRTIAMAERYLRRAVSYSVHTLETTQNMQQDAQLLSLCSAMSDSLYRQDEQMLLYKRSAKEYNSALHSPGVGIVAGIFGFSPVAVGQ